MRCDRRSFCCSRRVPTYILCSKIQVSLFACAHKAVSRKLRDEALIGSREEISETRISGFYSSREAYTQLPQSVDLLATFRIVQPACSHLMQMSCSRIGCRLTLTLTVQHGRKGLCNIPDCVLRRKTYQTHVNNQLACRTYLCVCLSTARDGVAATRRIKYLTCMSYMAISENS